MNNNKIDDVIFKFLPEEEGFNKEIIEAINYSVKNGGKRLRPMFMYLTYRICGGKLSIIEPFMAAIEMIHCYSLVHDDLPCMDNDTLRRGKATTWSKYGEDVGVLTGDGLLNLAYETMLNSLDKYSDEDKLHALSAIKFISNKAGYNGMVGGQFLDVVSEGKRISKEEIGYIHKNKTCALIEASMAAGAILAGAKNADEFEEIGYNVGMAFQIQDDILDVIGDESVTGKPVHSDEKNKKNTYVTIAGLDKAKNLVFNYSTRACELLENVDGAIAYKTVLKELFESLIDRDR